MRNRKHFIQLAILAATAFVIVVTGPSFAADKLLCGSTATTSSHYVYTVSAGKAINAVSGDQVNVTVVATGGAVDNLERINRGQLNMGIGTWATFYQAYRALANMKVKPGPKFGVCGFIHPTPRTMWSGRTAASVTWRD